MENEIIMNNRQKRNYISLFEEDTEIKWLGRLFDFEWKLVYKNEQTYSLIIGNLGETDELYIGYVKELMEMKEDEN